MSVGELASAKTYSASRDNSDDSRSSDGPVLLGEGMDLLLEAWGMPAGAVGRDCKEGSEDLREEVVLSRFEKNPRKAGAMGALGRCQAQEMMWLWVRRMSSGRPPGLTAANQN